MAEVSDPFVWHPELRALISDPLASFFRSFRPEDLDERLQQNGAPADWRRSDVEREDSRARTLSGRYHSDLWIFAYGSLMWDPAIRFDEVRHARIHGLARRFCLKDTLGGRGTAEAPGLMAALDQGPGCDGLVFRVAKDRLEDETKILWRREMLGRSYKPLFAHADTAQGTVEALAFAADRAAGQICPHLSRSEQVRYIATGKGFLGTSLQYIESLASHFNALGIDDEDVTSLLDEARRYASAERKEVQGQS